jgi:hypothetical protein
VIATLRTLIRFLLPLLLLATIGCSSSAPLPSQGQNLTDGKGAVVCLKKEIVLWLQVRASAITRSEGWGKTESALVVYPTRGINPVFVGKERTSVIWLDRDKIIGITQIDRSPASSPTQPDFIYHKSEVTAAILIPPKPPNLNIANLAIGDTVIILCDNQTANE